MGSGLFGKILWINLTEESFKEEIIPEEIYRHYLGGYGLAVKLIYENMPAKVDSAKCTGCETCVDECPSDAIKMSDDKAVIIEDACIDCGVCVDACPEEAITLE